MAPKPHNDHQDENTASPRETSGAGSVNDGERTRSTGRPDEPVDFGAFVSRSVRSSADRFRQGTGKPASESSATTRGKTGAEPDVSTPPAPRKRSARYWRDSLRESSADDSQGEASGSQRFLGPAEGEAEADAGGGGGFAGWWQGIVGGGDGEGPNRSMIVWFLVGLVVMLLVLFLIIRAFGGGDEPEPEPTETPVPTQIVSPGSGPDVEPQATSDVPTTEPTETPEIRRGGDNQLGGDREGTPEARIEITPAVESPLAKECTEQCLVRVVSDDIWNVLEETGNRPSFSGDDLAWVIATPTQVSLLDERADIDLVRDSEETLHLYAVTVPQGEDPDLVNNYGEVLDAVGPYRLVEFDDIPARVTTLTNNGYNVNKVAPAPPLDPVQLGSRPPLSEVNAGTLMGQVSEQNVVDDITELQASGSTDGSGIGTRYYTYPGNQVAADFLYRQLESYGLSVWYEDFLTPEGILLVNVVGEVPGEDDSAVYAVMAHLDSINVEDSPATAPGADDNSTGMAVSLEIARILAQYRLEHPVRFVFVNAEEVGIIGSSVWAKRANSENLPVDGVFNVDSVGSDRQGRLIVLNSNAGSAWLQDILISVNDAYGLGQNIETHQNPEIVADDNMVRDQGIDAVMIARELYGWSPVHHSARDVVGNVSIDNTLTMTYLVLLSVVELAK